MNPSSPNQEQNGPVDRVIAEEQKASDKEEEKKGMELKKAPPD